MLKQISILSSPSHRTWSLWQKTNDLYKQWSIKVRWCTVWLFLSVFSHWWVFLFPGVVAMSQTKYHFIEPFGFNLILTLTSACVCGVCMMYEWVWKKQNKDKTVSSYKNNWLLSRFVVIFKCWSFVCNLF